SLPGGDFDVILQSVDRRLFTLPEDMLVLPGHGLDTTIGSESPHLEEWAERGWGRTRARTPNRRDHAPHCGGQPRRFATSGDDVFAYDVFLVRSETVTRFHLSAVFLVT